MINGEVKKIDRKERDRAVGLLLYLFRRRSGMQQKALAEKVGFPASYISMLENGNRKISISMIHKLAEVLSLRMREKEMLMKAAGYSGFTFETYWMIQDILHGTLIFAKSF